MLKRKCSHCMLEFDENAMIIDEKGFKFCCSGCKNVYEILHSSGLGEFYERLGKNTLTPVDKRSYENLDERYAGFIKKEGEFSKISLVVEGIRCSACVGLIEKILFNTDGILEVNFNVANDKLIVIWDETQTNLGEILRRLGSVGYDAHPYDVSRQEDELAAKRREFYVKLLVGIFCTMNIMWLAVAQYSGYFSGIRADIKAILNFAEFVLATPVLFYTGGAFFAGAKIAVKNGAANMDLLVATGASSAYIYSVYAMFSRKGETYFDSVAMIITFVFIGKFLEILSKKRAADTIDGLNYMLLGEVSVIKESKILQKSPHEINIGDKIVLQAGQRALIDGIMLDGEGSFDTSCISGESMPIDLIVGDEVKSGTICLDGRVIYEAGASFENSFLNKIINLLQNASLKKPHIEGIANKISSKFSLVIIALALITFGFWYMKFNFEAALITAISVIVIACPCALALATPVSTLVALGVGLKNRVVFKEARMIESLAKCDTVVFDKTGTLSKARLCVDKFINFKELNLDAIYSLAASSKHPVSIAVAKFLADEGAKTIPVNSVREIAARGITAKMDGKILLAGSRKFMLEQEIKVAGEIDEKSVYFVAFDGELVAKFELSDAIKDDAKECLNELKRMGLKIYMLTGDNENTAKSVAKTLDILNFEASCLPEQKAKFIHRLQKNGSKVIMVGDGLNDTLALSYANIAVCMGGGADASLEKSDVILLDDSLKSFVSGVKIARYTLRTIKQNLAFSIFYNLLTIPLAATGYIIPLFAAISMSFSSVIVVLNSLSVRAKFKDKK
ncbi:MAG: cadmium-translocating P-type ATPase [Campylobacter sp.]|nr:cadmium-translocating P-type ATPase [Campylobacter sp.]